MLSDHLRMYALSAIQRKGHKRKKPYGKLNSLP